jgi:hypothetical protein
MQRYGPDKEEDIGIVLQDLCVVDIDCMGIDREMNVRFPELSKTMCERTKKGHHYFFKRSKLADDGGYYDGAGQRIHKVDFKTICSNGTGGFIVVAPSKNKTWVTSFKDIDDLPTISDQLLNYVARPTHKKMTLTVKFSETDEEIHVEDSLVLTRFAIMGMFDEADEITLPFGSLHQFQTILDVMENQELVLKDEPNRLSFVKKLSKMADFLGIRVADFTALKTKWLEIVRLYDVHPEMAEALEVTESIDYTTALVDETMTVNKKFGKDAIFPRQCDRRPTSPLIDLEFAKQEIPSDVLYLLESFPGEVVLAGGFATGCMVKDIEIGNDIDLFIVGTEERAQMIMEFVLVDVLPDHASFRTGNAVTFFVKDTINGDIPVQIILKLHTDILHVIEGFDIEPSKAAIYCDANGQLHGMVTKGWVECARTYSFPVLAQTWTSSSTYRIIKYAAKGFQPYICGLQARFREREYMFPLRDDQVREDLINSLQNCLGIEELLHAERYYKRENVYGWDANLTPTTMACLSGLFRGIRRSDYAYSGWGVSAWRRLTRGAAQFFQYIMGVSRKSRTFEQLTYDNCGEILFWKRAVGRRVHNCFYKAAANLEGIVEE